MISSAVFVPAVALQTKFHSPANFSEILGVRQRRLHMLCRPEKAYDWFPREKISCGVFREYGVGGRLLLAVKSLYSLSEVCVRVSSVKPRPLAVAVGLRQGCALSPLVFIVYIRPAQFRKLEGPNYQH